MSAAEHDVLGPSLDPGLDLYTAACFRNLDVGRTWWRMIPPSAATCFVSAPDGLQYLSHGCGPRGASSGAQQMRS